MSRTSINTGGSANTDDPELALLSACESSLDMELSDAYEDMLECSELSDELSELSELQDELSELSDELTEESERTMLSGLSTLQST